MTPIQKSIADIEAKIADIRRIREERDKTQSVSTEEIRHTEMLIAAFHYSISALTANREYERDVIVQAWTDGTYGIGDNAHDYYTKTYNKTN